jgi:chromate reductase
MYTLKVLAMCGSLRLDSYNRQLLAIAKKIATDLGATVVEADLKLQGLPTYDGDIEAVGMPEPVQQLKKMTEESDVLLIATPEYNYSIPGGLKNAIDWLSRGERNSLGNKVAAIFGASTGPYGTVRGQAQLRLCLTAVNVLLLPKPQVMVRYAQEAFNIDGSLKDEKTAARLKTLIQKTFALADSM